MECCGQTYMQGALVFTMNIPMADCDDNHQESKQF